MVLALGHRFGAAQRHHINVWAHPSSSARYTRLGIEEQNQIVVADGGERKPLGVVGIAWANHLEPRSVHEDRFGRLRVVVAAFDTAADRHAHHDRARKLARRAISVLGGFVDQLIHRGIDEVAELNLGHGSQAVERHADRGADDAGLGERRVDHTLAAELLLQAGGHAKHAANLPTSSPNTTTRSSAAHLGGASASLIALTMFICGIVRLRKRGGGGGGGGGGASCWRGYCTHRLACCSSKCSGMNSNTSFEHAGEIRRRSCLGLFDARVELGRHALLERRLVGFAEDALPLQVRNESATSGSRRLQLVNVAPAIAVDRPDRPRNEWPPAR